MKKIFAIIAALVLLCMAGGSAFAGWTVVNLNPAGATVSYAYGISGGQQVGYAYLPGTYLYHAGLWSGTAGSWIDLNPAGVTSSGAYGISGGRQVGGAAFVSHGPNHAGLWSGSAGSWVDLNPAGAIQSCALGISGGQQVGYAEFGAQNYHAGVWSGTAESWVDLHPAGASQSCALGSSGGQQVGYADLTGTYLYHAGLWSGTAASWVDLHPAGALFSKALCMSVGQQAGFAAFGGEMQYTRHAGLWRGTAGSWVDLNPGDWYDSCVHGVSGDKQVGFAGVHAGMWSGTAQSWVDLHALLPVGVYSSSEARDIEVSASEIWVVGKATRTSTGNDEAMLWHYEPDPEPFSLILNLVPDQVTVGQSVETRAYVADASSVRLTFAGSGQTFPAITMSHVGGNKWTASFGTGFLASARVSSVTVVAAAVLSTGQTVTGSAVLWLGPHSEEPAPGDQLHIWSNDTQTDGLATSSYTETNPGGTPLHADLFMTQDLNLWFGLLTSSSGQAIDGPPYPPHLFSLPEIMGCLGVVDPGGTVAWKGTFYQPGDSITMELTPSTPLAATANVAMILMHLIPGGTAVQPSSLMDVLNDLRNIAAIASASDAFIPEPKGTWAWTKACGKAAWSLRKLIADDAQRAALRQVLTRIGLSLSDSELKTVFQGVGAYSLLKVISSEVVFIAQTGGDTLKSTFTAYGTGGGAGQGMALTPQPVASTLVASPALLGGSSAELSTAAIVTPSQTDWLTEYTVTNSSMIPLWSYTLYYDADAGAPMQIGSPPAWAYDLDSANGTVTWYTQGPNGWIAGDFGASTIPPNGQLAGFSVRHTNPSGYMMCGGQDTSYAPSFGETVGPTSATGLAAVKLRCDSLPMCASDKVVTAHLPDGSYYISDPLRSCGIRATGLLAPTEGDVVRVSGVMAVENGEPVIHVDRGLVTSHGTAPKALGIRLLDLAGGDLGAQPGVINFPFEPPSGTEFSRVLNNIGLLVATWGRVTGKGDGYLYIDDGSVLMDGTLTGEADNVGVRVVCDPTSYTTGDFLIVTGISSCFETPSGKIARRILTRKPEDVRKITTP